MDDSDEAMIDVFTKFIKLSTEIVDETGEPLIIAACAMQLGMMIYKTVLSEQDFIAITDRVYEMRDKIVRFEPNSEFRVH